MTRELLNQIAKAKKINLNDYEYYYGQIIKGYIHIYLGVRCAVGVAAPLTMKTIKLRACAVDKKYFNDESDYASWDYETEGHYLYIPTMK